VSTAFERVERIGSGALQSVANNVAARQALAVIAAVLGVLATIWLIRTGDAGAKSVWGPRVDILFPDR